MSAATSQAFRAQSSSNIILIPTRYDGRSKQHVIRWKDIQLRFKDAQFVMNGENTVLFLTDDDLEDLIPLRIAHHPEVVLEVAITDENQVMRDAQQGDSRSMVQRDDRDVASLKIGDVENNQALVVRSHGHTAAVAVQLLPDTSTSHCQQETGDNVTLQEQLHELQQQMAGVFGKMQQSEQQTQHAQQQMQDQIDKILQTLQQTNRQLTEHTQRMTQQLDLHRQQLEEALYTSQHQLQQQIEMVQQKTEQLEQDKRNSLQQMLDIQQHVEQRLGKVLNNTQELDQKAQHTEQQHNQLLQQMQETASTSNQLARARSHIQAVLGQPFPRHPIPRLFILLPAPTYVDDEQGESHQPQFLLYFLCECGSHTMGKNCTKPHEIHLANHPGYELYNQDEFISKYGSHLLTMMYMVKYGVKTRELVVPPLPGHKHALREGENTGQLVDDTISHLKTATGYTASDTTPYQSLDATELAELKSHLRVKDGEGFSGGLSQMKVSKGHYTWICRNHWCESFEQDLQQLKCNVNDNGGVWNGNKANINVTSEAMTRLFYNALSKLFRTETVENQQPWTAIDFGQDRQQSESDSTTDIPSNPDDLESLSLDFGRFTMAIKGISRGEIKDVATSIGSLSAPTLDDMEFIQQCRPTTLTILKPLQVRHESRLVSILQSNLSITSLRIECDIERLISVIDLVKSTREMIFQGEDKPALRILELIHPEIKVKVSFEERSQEFDVESCVKLENRPPMIVNPAVSTFIRQYGWSVTTLVAPRTFSDTLAKLLEESIQENGSGITHLDMTPTSLTTPGLDAMNRVIDRSRELTYLRLSLENNDQHQQRQKAHDLLERHKVRLTSLHLTDYYYIDEFHSLFSKTLRRDAFPALEEFFVESTNSVFDTSQTIKSMVSAPWQQRTSLKVLGMKFRLQNERQWEEVIKAIDLSALEELHFYCPKSYDDNHRRFKTFVDRISASDSALLPLRLLYLHGTISGDSAYRSELFGRLRGRIPDIKITEFPHI
ncbi:hypothetical protein BGX34_011564 [Mortierella sp. NVP85]|nr:hypothetical protein BGX34_011564 [Mortierella sp. NVP85]